VALIDWLKRQKVAPKVDAPPAADAKPTAWIEPAFDSGSVVLMSGDRLVRVVWPLGGEDKRRVLAPGKYTVRELRFEHTHKGAHWFLSSSGPPYQKVEVAARGGTKLVIPDEITCTTKAKRKGAQLNISFAMGAKNGHGITIFKKSLRVPVTYRVLDKDGRELAAGKMNYG